MKKTNKNFLKNEKSNEKTILKALLNNARKSTVEIAKETGVTRQTVSKIINKFEKDGRIWGYATVMEPELLDNHFYLVLLKIKEDIDKGELMKKISNSVILNKFTEENFRYSSYMHGKFDFMTSFYASNLIEAEKKVNNVFKPFRKYLSELYLHQIIITFRRMGILNPNLNKEIEEHFNI